MCEFEKVSKEELIGSISYIVSTSILNKKGEFTLEDICNDVSVKLIDISKVEVKNYIEGKLNMFLENGLIIEFGSYFSVKDRM